MVSGEQQGGFRLREPFASGRSRGEPRSDVAHGALRRVRRAGELSIPMGIGRSTITNCTRNACLRALELKPGLLDRMSVNIYQEVPYLESSRIISGASSLR